VQKLNPLAVERLIMPYECVAQAGNGKLIYVKAGLYGTMEGATSLVDETRVKLNLPGLKTSALSRGPQRYFIDKKGAYYTNLRMQVLGTLDIDAYVQKLYWQLDIEEKARAAQQEAQDRWSVLLDLVAIGVAIAFPASIFARLLPWAVLGRDVVRAIANEEIEKFTIQEAVKFFAGCLLKRYMPIAAPQMMYRVTKSPSALAVTAVVLNTKRAEAVIGESSDFAVETAFCALSDEERKLGPTETALLAVHRLRLQVDPSYPQKLKQLSQIAKDLKSIREKRVMYEIDHR
jgi:hypothetical protein